MKPISVHVPEGTYQELKSLATRSGRPVAELIRQAMAGYIEQERRSHLSILDIEPFEGGALLSSWERSDVLDEMLDEKMAP